MEQDELPVKKSVDNAFRGEMSERIRHARTLPEHKENRTLREKRESVFFLWKITAFAITNCSANFAKNDY